MQGYVEIENYYDIEITVEKGEVWVVHHEHIIVHKESVKRALEIIEETHALNNFAAKEKVIEKIKELTKEKHNE